MMLVQAAISATQEAEVEGWQVQSQPEQFSETLLKSFFKGGLEVHIGLQWSTCPRCMRSCMQLQVESKRKQDSNHCCCCCDCLVLTDGVEPHMLLAPPPIISV